MLTKSILLTTAFLLGTTITWVSSFVVKSPSLTSIGSSRTAAITTELNAAALIVQNKGGGHGELGYQLAKVLATNAKIDSITILQDDACKMSAEPFASYTTDLPDNVNIIYAPIGNDEAMTSQTLETTLQGKSFEYIWDNASKKDAGIGKALIDCAVKWKPKLLCYVSSAGIYTPTTTDPIPMDESNTPIKTTAGQCLYDQYAVKCGLPLVSFRPQYIYGPKSNKFDYIDYFFDRLVRNLPIPIPGDGTQLVSLTNAEDVATLLASPLDNEQAAIQQRFFNCGTDQLISYNDLAYLCAEVAQLPKFNVKIEYFDGDALGTKGKFPFRLTNFFVTPDQAKKVLSWPGPVHTLEEDLVWYYEDYVKRGGPTKKMSLIKDWEIVVGCKTSVPDYVASIYEQYDPIILEPYEPTSKK